MNIQTKALWVFAGVVALSGLIFIVQPRISSEEVTIGVLVPLTGPSANIGERVKAGVEVGVDTLRDQGVNVRVVFEDDKGEATRAVSAARKLIDTDGAQVIIGTVKSDAMLAVAPITEEERVILLSPTAGASAISQAGDFVFRVIETPDIHGEAAASYIGADARVALFVAKASNAQSYGDAFTLGFEQQGGELLIQSSYNQDDTDFRTEIAKALQRGPDALYLAVATAKDAGLLVKQAREAGFAGLIVASVAADAKEFFDTANLHAEGTVITSSYFDETSEAGSVFNLLYKEKTGNNGDGFAANGYDAILLLGKAIQNCGERTECIRDFLYATRGYEGAGGTLTFDANGDVRKPVSIKVARDGQFVLAD